MAEKKKKSKRGAHLKAHQWKKGESGNPLSGAHPNHDPVGKKLKKITADEVHEIVTLLLEQPLPEMEKLAKSKTAPMLRVWIATVALKSVKDKSFGNLEKLLDRSIGPIAQRHEHSGPNGGPIDQTTSYLTTEERRKAIDELRRAREKAGDE